jgi:hypothetical protein
VTVGAPSGSADACHQACRQFVLEGTRPHVIRPKRAKTLCFEVGGEAVFAQRVRATDGTR